MKPRFLLVWFVALGALALAFMYAPAKQASASDEYFFGFSQTVKPWLASTDLPGAAPYETFRVQTGDNGCPDLLGNSFANLKASTAPLARVQPYPVGTWVYAAFPVSGLNQVDVQYSAKNTAGCLGCHPMTYIGAKPPVSSLQFKVSNDLQGLRSTWRTFGSSAVVNALDQVYVGYGWPGTDAAVGFDCVRVSIKSVTGADAAATK